jgi:hypothetical protein
MADDNNLPQDDNLTAEAGHVAGEMTDVDGAITDPNMTATGAPTAEGTPTDAELADLKTSTCAWLPSLRTTSAAPPRSELSCSKPPTRS